jgi:hypothetical protein
MKNGLLEPSDFYSYLRHRTWLGKIRHVRVNEVGSWIGVSRTEAAVRSLLDEGEVLTNEDVRDGSD